MTIKVAGLRWALWQGGVLALVALLASCRPQPTRIDPAKVAQGKQLYQSLACTSCHALDEVGSQRSTGPTHNHIASTAAQRIRAPNYTGHATSVAGYLRESMVDPKIYIVPGYTHVRFGMPSFAHLAERDLDALVQFLLTQQ